MPVHLLLHARDALDAAGDEDLTFAGDEGFPGDAYNNNNIWQFAPRIGVVWDPTGDGRQTIRAVVRPLTRLNEAMLNITQAKLDNRILVERDDEVGEALRNLQTRQAIVGFDGEELKATEKRASTRGEAGTLTLAAGRIGCE